MLASWHTDFTPPYPWLVDHFTRFKLVMVRSGRHVHKVSFFRASNVMSFVIEEIPLLQDHQTGHIKTDQKTKFYVDLVIFSHHLIRSRFSTGSVSILPDVTTGRLIAITG